MNSSKMSKDMLSWAQETAKQTGRELIIIDSKEEFQRSHIMGMFAKEYEGNCHKIISSQVGNNRTSVMISGQACNGQMKDRELNRNPIVLGECEE